MSTRTKYSDAFKASQVRRITAAGGPTAYELSRELGIGSSTLYLWVKQAEERGNVASKKSKRPRDWSAAEKFGAVTDTSGLSDEELGLYLRKHGIHEEHLVAWREQCEQALAPPARASMAERQMKKENLRLNRELKRKNAALAETAALLVLSKKFTALWEDEGENT